MELCYERSYGGKLVSNLNKQAQHRRQLKRRNRTNKVGHNRTTGAFSARLLQRWPQLRSWHENPLRAGRKKPLTKGMAPRDRRH